MVRVDLVFSHRLLKYSTTIVVQTSRDMHTADTCQHYRPAFDGWGHRDPLLARPTKSASHRVSVRQVVGFVPLFLRIPPHDDVLAASRL